ncbi:MAG TPA: type II secretion system F family protein [Gaiellaceae bacterium]|jgi:tight adherence protein C|nr:type II secretion system F family protein [Gaiellaceae bacterium]
MMLLIIAIACLAGAVFLIGEVATLPSRERERSIRRARTYGFFRIASPLDQQRLRERALEPLRETLARWVLKVNPKTSMETISLRLLGAGLGRRLSPTGFLAAKGFLAVGGGLMGVLITSVTGSGMGLLFIGALGAGGFIAPDYFVSLKAKGRRESIRADLPDALDLLAVSVEAGLGFDGAIAKLTEHMEGPLAEEFGLTLGEMRIGESRQDALKRMSERVDAPELSSFTRAIIQADQLGTSLGRILRVQAADTRLRRQAAAEERAMKAPIKMLFPTVLFIFPAMFLIILGPAFLNLDKIF